MKPSASAARAAARICSGVAPGAPKAMLSAIEAEKRKASSNTIPTERRSSASRSRRTSVPSRVTLPAVGVVEAGQEQREGGLPRTAGPHEGDPLPGLDPQAEAVEQRRSVVAVAEAHVLEGDRAVDVADRLGVGRLDHLGAGVEQLEDPHGPGPGHLTRRQQPRQHAGRGRQLQEVAVEGQERAQRDVAVDHQPAAGQEQGGHPEAGQHLDERHEPGLDADVAQLGAVQRPGRGLQPGHLPLLGGEGLDHPDAGDGLVDDAGHVGRPLLGRPGGGEDPVPHPARGHGEGGEHHEGDGGQHRAEHQHDNQRQHQHHQVADHERQKGQQHLNHADVAARPRHRLPGLQAIVGGEVEPGQMLVDRIPQVVLDVVADPPGVQPPHQRRPEPHDPEPEQRNDAAGRQRPPRRHVVDEVPQDERPEDSGHHADHGPDQGEDHRAPMPLHERPQAPHPPPSLRRSYQPRDSSDPAVHEARLPGSANSVTAVWDQGGDLRRARPCAPTATNPRWAACRACLCLGAVVSQGGEARLLQDESEGHRPPSPNVSTMESACFSWRSTTSSSPRS